MVNGRRFEKWKIGHRTTSINAKTCSCQKCHHRVGKVSLYAMLSTLSILPNKTEKNIKKTKTGFSFL